MSTRLWFEAPSDLSVGTIQITGEGQTLADWVATPANRVFEHDDVTPGVYVSTISPVGLSSRSVVFEVREGQDNRVILPSFSVLSSSGNQTTYFDIERQQTLAQVPPSIRLKAFTPANEQAPHTGSSSSANESGSEPSRYAPITTSSAKKRIAIGLSQEREGLETFDVFAGHSRLELFPGWLEIEIESDPGHDPWAGQRIRLSAAIEGLRVERCLLPSYRGGTQITLAAPTFSPADLEFVIVPIDPSLRALLRALDAGTSAEVMAVRDDVLGGADPDELLAEQADPWAAILVGLLAIRFESMFTRIDLAWADKLAERAGWAYDAQVIHAQLVLSAARDASPAALDYAVSQAVCSLARAQVAGSPYYRYTNQLFTQMANGIGDFFKTDRPSILASTRTKFDSVIRRWHRELALQRGAGATFTWLSRDQAALKERQVLVPYEGASGYLRRDSTSILFEGLISAGQIEVISGDSSTTRHRPQGASASIVGQEDELEQMPALGRPSGPDDDPNLGRFGGQASQAGFELSAAFEATSSLDWVTVILTLEASQSTQVGLGDFAWFVLHPTFSPSALKVTFRGRRAQLRLQVWGGFTVGVWLPKAGVELECNLAKLERAPIIIQTL